MVDSGKPIITSELWQKVAQLPLEDLESWGRTFALTANDGDQVKIVHMLECLEVTARLWAIPAYREADLAEGEVITLESIAKIDPNAIDSDSFTVQMHAEHGTPQLRNHMKDDFPEVS
jgi:hypothetical protein